MRLTSYAEAGVFLADTRGILERQEVANGLLLGLATRLAADPLAYGSLPYMAVVEQDGKPRLAALMTPPHNVILAVETRPAESGMAPAGLNNQTPAGPSVAAPPGEHGSIDRALALVTEDLLSRGWPVAGALGLPWLAQAFADGWCARTGAAARPGTSQRVYELRHVTPPAGVPGHLRAAGEADADLVAQWIAAFHDEATPDSPWPDLPAFAKQRIAEGIVYLWDDGRTVSMAVRSRATEHGAAVGDVYTPPEHRRHGYASALVAALSQRLLDAGFAFCTLFTNLANPTSNNIYQQIGYRPVCDFQEIKFSPPPEPAARPAETPAPHR